jgi:hypothetical protein
MIKFLEFADPKTCTEENPEGEIKKYPVRVSYFALKMIKAKLGRTLSVNDDGTDYDAYEALFYYSLIDGWKKVHPITEFPFTEEETIDILRDVFFEFMKMLPAFLSDEHLEEVIKKESGKGKKELGDEKK